MYSKNIQRFILIGLILSFLCSCVVKNLEPPPESKPELADTYLIGPEDILKIHVWKQDNISVTVPVRSDGKITVPLIKDVQAAGRTPDTLSFEIAEKLKKYIDEPTVTVIVEAINSLKISVSGNVNSPGVYKVGGVISLTEVISLAGGLNEVANDRQIRIIRRSQDGAEKMYQIDYYAVINGDINKNVSIYPGDSVIVP
jgi:polysaccharide export outer membrane protein